VYSEKRTEKKGQLQKLRLQAIRLARTTKNHTKVRVDNLKLYQIIRKSDKTDLIFLIALPIPMWPIYFLVASKIKILFRKICFLISKARHQNSENKY
jgi:hypothetical protein